LERIAKVASFSKFDAPKLEGLPRWIVDMRSETFAKGELLPIITKEVGHERRGRDGLVVSVKEVRKA